MAEKWLAEDKLCTFDEKVRVELGPQIIELDCTAENLRDEVTHPQYRIGKIDAYGRTIMFDALTKAEQAAAPKRSAGTVEQGETMFCVDWRAKHVPHVWKVYQMQETDDIERFIQVDEYEDRDAALARAKELRAEMN